MIGAGVFLLVVGFVLGVIPGMIDPFSDSQETTLVADRLATQLAEGMMAEPDQPTVLNQTCLDAFFGVGSACRGRSCPVPFDEADTDLPDRLGVNDRHSINVTIERDIDGDSRFEVLSSDGTDVGDTGTRLAIGRLAAGHPVGRRRQPNRLRRREGRPAHRPGVVTVISLASSGVAR
ncbi:MAG: hypothetical protein U5J98_08145 [Halobacteriales archaeon]|nr:hypothetical protein [Halobacteriales archaeon]